MTKMTSRNKRNGPGCYNREGSNATVRVHIKARITRSHIRQNLIERYEPSLIEWWSGMSLQILNFTKENWDMGIK